MFVSLIVSQLSEPVSATSKVYYTFPSLVSEATGGEVRPEEVSSAWLDWVIEEIDRQTGTTFRALSFTDELDGTDQDFVFTRKFPLIQIDRVEVDGVQIPSSVYKANLRTGKITLVNGDFPEGTGNIVIVGVYGYPEVPALIRKIATLLVAKTALSAKNGPLVDSENIGDFSQTRTFKKLNDELDRAWGAWGKRFSIDLL
jgi:hypothetical protein